MDRENPCQKPSRVFDDVFLYFFDFLSNKNLKLLGLEAIAYMSENPLTMPPSCNLAPKFHELSFCPKYCAQSSFSHDLPLQKNAFYRLASLKDTAVSVRQTVSASGVVENLLDSVRQFGFVPNGARIYYLDRWKHVELKGGKEGQGG